MVAYTLSEFLSTFEYGYRKDGDKYFVFDWQDRQLVANRDTEDGSYTSIPEIVKDFSDHFYDQIYDYLDDNNAAPADYAPDDDIAGLLPGLRACSDDHVAVDYINVVNALLHPESVTDDFGSHLVPAYTEEEDEEYYYDDEDYDDEN